MLWYKSWLETRWRFLIGLVLMLCSAAGVVLLYPQVMRLMPMAKSIDVSGEIGRRIHEAVELQHTYRGYIWSQWFRQNLSQLATLFAVLLGTGGLLAQRSGGAALYTLSMPVSRTRLLTVRAATGLGELFVLALVPALLIPMLSPAVGESYSVVSTLVHVVCVFIACSVFYSFAFLLSTVFADVWRPLLVALALALVLSAFEQLFRPSIGLFRVMSAESYFRSGQLPWLGLLACVAASIVMQYAAATNIARRDF